LALSFFVSAFRTPPLLVSLPARSSFAFIMMRSVFRARNRRQNLNTSRANILSIIVGSAISVMTYPSSAIRHPVVMGISLIFFRGLFTLPHTEMSGS